MLVYLPSVASAFPYVTSSNMAFTEDSLKAKLSSLNETQEAISTVGQWILFHRYIPHHL